MNGDRVWNYVFSRLTSLGEELQTSTGLWFKVFIDNGQLFADKALLHSPSCKITTIRRITKSDFLSIYPYYKRWINYETGAREEARNKSKNTAYIFSLIDKFGQ